jgi:hypothetical protein
VDSEALASMYNQIVLGVPKEQSRFVTDEKSSATWDQIAAEVEQMKAENPAVWFDVPNELPSIDGPNDPAWTGQGPRAPAGQEVSDALQQLHPGERTVEDVAEFFRTRYWPMGTEPAPSNFKDAARAEQHDVDQPAAGSFAEVAFAYSAGVITFDQYAVLAKAAAEAIKAQRAEQPPSPHQPPATEQDDQS